MGKNRFLDPMARATSFAARKGGMRDDQQAERRMRRVERILYGAQSDDSGDIPDGWSMMEEVDTQPAPTPDIIGRMFVQRNDGAEDVLSVGITAADGSPILVGLNTLAPDAAAVALSLEAALSLGTSIPHGVAIDASTNIYLAYQLAGFTTARLSKYNAALVPQWSTDISTGSGVPTHVSTDNTNLYLFREPPARGVKLLTSTGAPGSPSTWGTTGTSAGQFQQPWGVANNATHVFATDKTRNKVIKYTLAGVFVSEFGATGSAQGQLSGPTGIVLDLSDNIYVCDTGNNRIQKFNSAGTWQATFGTSAGNADGQFNAPEGIAVDDTGNIWVADTGNHRVQVIDSAGVYVAKVGGYGSGSGQLNQPKDIALGDGYGYVVDYGNKRISRVKVAAQHTHTNSVTIRTATSGNIAPGTAGGVTVTCNADEVCTGGGYSSSNSAGVSVYYSFPSGNGWNAYLTNTSGTNRTITAYANCLKAVI